MNTKRVFTLLILTIFIINLVPSFVSAIEPKPGAPTISAQEWNSAMPNAPGLATAFRYIFGKVAAPSNVTDPWAAAIITIAVWLLIFITFADIIDTFSTFSKGVSWGVGFLIALIVANFGGMVGFISWITVLFSWLGTIAVFVGIGASFVAFLAVNLGLVKLKGFLQARVAMSKAAGMRSGGIKVGGAIQGMKEIGKELERDE